MFLPYSGLQDYSRRNYVPAWTLLEPALHPMTSIDHPLLPCPKYFDRVLAWLPFGGSQGLGVHHILLERPPYLGLLYHACFPNTNNTSWRQLLYCRDVMAPNVFIHGPKYLRRTSWAMFKIEALVWVSFWRALKFQFFNQRACSDPRHQFKNIEM